MWPTSFALKSLTTADEARIATLVKRAVSSHGNCCFRKTVDMPLPNEIIAYNVAQTPSDKNICDALAKAIDVALPSAECKIWHRHPVWFLNGNPIVGYSKLKDAIRLMFWSGQSFNEPGLPAEPPDTKFRSAGIRFTSVDEINAKDLKRWLAKSIAIQWDYKSIVKRKGKLVRLK